MSTPTANPRAAAEAKPTAAALRAAQEKVEARAAERKAQAAAKRAEAAARKKQAALVAAAVVESAESGPNAEATASTEQGIQAAQAEPDSPAAEPKPKRDTQGIRAIVLTAYDAGTTKPAEIAKGAGVSASRVRQILMLEGRIKSGGKNQLRDEEIMRAVESGESLAAVAERYGMGTGRIRSIHAYTKAAQSVQA